MNKVKKRPLIMFFSQTGKEIFDIVEECSILPTLIVTNKRPKDRIIYEKLLERFSTRLIVIPNKPTVQDYNKVLGLFKNPLVTLHGWLRIIPEDICNKYEIYNGHPGLITLYPELKGKDPQEKAFNLKHEIGGCVLHRVTPEVDAGEIVSSVQIKIKDLDLDTLYEKLREYSIFLWREFFNKYKQENQI